MKNKKFGLLVLFYCLATNGYANNDIHMVKNNHEIKWLDMPNSAAKYIVVAGDPKKEDYFVVRIKFPANYSIAPHYHNHYEYDTVITGSCYIAKGKIHKKENGLLATAGTFVSIPPHLVHYGWSGSEGAVIQISGMGPWKPIIYNKQNNKQNEMNGAQQ